MARKIQKTTDMVIPKAETMIPKLATLRDEDLRPRIPENKLIAPAIIPRGGYKPAQILDAPRITERKASSLFIRSSGSRSR